MQTLHFLSWLIRERLIFSDYIFYTMADAEIQEVAVVAETTEEAAPAEAAAAEESTEAAAATEEAAAE